MGVWVCGYMVIRWVGGVENHIYGFMGLRSTQGYICAHIAVYMGTHKYVFMVLWFSRRNAARSAVKRLKNENVFINFSQTEILKHFI